MRVSTEAYASAHTQMILHPKGLFLHTPDGHKSVDDTIINDATNFGTAYNKLLTHVFATYPDEGVIIANDDVVLTPDTMRLMREDVAELRTSAAQEGYRLGLVGARSDFVLPAQNIRIYDSAFDDYPVLHWLRWPSELRTKPASVIAPIFAYISREAFTAAQFPPINWYSDNVICEDLSRKGFAHYVSRAYVHHAG